MSDYGKECIEFSDGYNWYHRNVFCSSCAALRVINRKQGEENQEENNENTFE